jgi:hypothetical protein
MLINPSFAHLLDEIRMDKKCWKFWQIKKNPKKSEKKKNENQTLFIHMQGSFKEYPNTSSIMNFINCFSFSIYKLACWEPHLQTCIFENWSASIFFICNIIHHVESIANIPQLRNKGWP